MIEDGSSGHVSIADVAVSERADEDLVDGGKEDLAEGFVGVLVDVEKFFVFGKSIAGIRNDCSSWMGGEFCFRTWIFGDVERGGGERCIDGGGDSEDEVAECSAAKVGLD